MSQSGLAFPVWLKAFVRGIFGVGTDTRPDHCEAVLASLLAT